MNIIPVPPCALGIRLQISFDMIFIKISYKTEATLILNIDLRQILNALVFGYFFPLAFVHLYYVREDTQNLWS